MAQRELVDVLRLGLIGERELRDVVPTLFDRTTGTAHLSEGPLIDFKLRIDLDSEAALAELARDIMAFSNTEGGLIVAGVNDQRQAIGHEAVDTRRMRQGLGPFMGTRVDHDCQSVSVTVRGNQLSLVAIAIPRSKAASPTLLRKSIEQRRLLHKVKYLSGSLFYREADQTFVQAPGPALEERALALGFSWAAPRTRSSFVLEVDRPLLRLYANINDRLFGRDETVSDLRASFDDPRGRGVSIAGLGGIGKTELAIRLVQELHSSGRFTRVYSGSAKQSLLGASGVQDVDPVFRDLPTFLKDLASWLGLQVASMAPSELEAMCVRELGAERVLLFVDNLETIKDRAFFEFLEHRLPRSVWLVLTGRVHRVRNFIKPIELNALDIRAAARLLRHELKRQGLNELADLDIDEIERTARSLYCHPLALRWFAWACKVTPSLWSKGPTGVSLRDLESFCIAHTLGHIPEPAPKVLAAIIAAKGVVEATEELLHRVAGVPDAELESALYELECAGLVTVGTRDDGAATFSAASLAEAPTSELARRLGWEREHADRIRSLVNSPAPASEVPPAMRDLLATSATFIKSYTSDERRALVDRLVRALQRCPEGLRPRLMALRAECERHEGNTVTADELYAKAADGVLSTVDPRLDRHRGAILLEAATVALNRGRTRHAAARALGYLEAVQDATVNQARLLGMLTEAAAIVGDRAKQLDYARRAEQYLNVHRREMSEVQIAQMKAALERAAAHNA